MSSLYDKLILIAHEGAKGSLINNFFKLSETLWKVFFFVFFFTLQLFFSVQCLYPMKSCSAICTQRNMPGYTIYQQHMNRRSYLWEIASVQTEWSSFRSPSTKLKYLVSQILSLWQSADNTACLNELCFLNVLLTWSRGLKK